MTRKGGIKWKGEVRGKDQGGEERKKKYKKGLGDLGVKRVGQFGEGRKKMMAQEWGLRWESKQGLGETKSRKGKGSEKTKARRVVRRKLGAT